MCFRQVLFKVLTLFIISILAFVCCELVLRCLRPPNRFYPYYPNTVRVFYPVEEITPGISGVSYFTVNSFGTRGPELDGEEERILTIGGSTTADTFLDDNESWSMLLMQYLNTNS